MSRSLRIEYKNAFYHIMNRGRRREKIFFDDDCDLFLSVLAEAVKLFNIKIYSYCLMSNHYHLLISVPDASISRAMRHINGVYTQKINRKHKLEGALFKGRYKSILIEEDSYFMECVRYIHRNPIKAGLVEEEGEYRWTSHKCYLNKKSRLDWLCVDEALAYWGQYEKSAINEYSRYVKQNVPEYFDKRLEGRNWPAVLGSEKFKDKIKNLFLGKDLTEVASRDLKEALPKESIEEAVELFLKHFNILKEKDYKRHKDYYKVRDFAIRYCREKLNYKSIDIARALKVSAETISRSYRMVRDNKEYDKILKNT